jgi:hypothetical protein
MTTSEGRPPRYCRAALSSAAPGRGCCGSQRTGFTETEVAVVGQHEMVDDVDADHIARPHHPRRERDVIAAGRGIARRVIVEQDDRRGAAGHRLTKHVPRFHGGRLPASDAEQHRPNHPIADVEQNQAEMLDAARAEARGQVGRSIARGQELLPGSVGPKERTAAQLDRGKELNRADGPDSPNALQVIEHHPGQTVKPPERSQHGVGEIERALSPRPLAEDDRRELVVAERIGAQSPQLLPRTILGRETLHHGYTLRAMPRLARRAACWIVFASLLTAAACAEPPNKELDQAQGAIEAARAAGADQFAPEAIKAAADALARAHTAVGQRDYRQALSAALDAKERAREAARTAAERMAQLRSEAERSIDGAARAIATAEQRLAAPESARLPATQRETMDVGIKAAGTTLQEARTAFEKQSYAQARTAAGVALTQVRETMATLDDADARAKRGAPRK